MGIGTQSDLEGIGAEDAERRARKPGQAFFSVYTERFHQGKVHGIDRWTSTFPSFFCIGFFFQFRYSSFLLLYGDAIFDWKVQF